MAVLDRTTEELKELVEESEQVEDEAQEDPVVAPVQYDITSFGADFDVQGLVLRLNSNNIRIPSFQRNYVWSQQEASRFIESLLLGLPVPGIFLAREPGSNKLLVIDGQQRLKTLQFFFDGYFKPSDEDDKKRVFKLQRVQKRFEGRTYEMLDEPDKVKLSDSLIHATIVKQDSPKDDDSSIYHIFDRLNSYGRLLNPQEIRTALYHGDLIEFIKDLNENRSWRSIFGKRSTRLKDQELILRFLALYFDTASYERPLNEFLTRFIRKRRDADEQLREESARVFESTIDLICRSLGKTAFRPKGPINAAVFDSVMIGLARRIVKGPITDYEKVKQAYVELLNDPEYETLVARSTSDESNVQSRIRLATARFSNV